MDFKQNAVLEIKRTIYLYQEDTIILNFILITVKCIKQKLTELPGDNHWKSAFIDLFTTPKKLFSDWNNPTD